MWEIIKAIIGFLIFVIILVKGIEWFSNNKKTDGFLKKIENFLLSLKIPYFIVQIILYIIVWVPIGALMYLTAMLIDYLGLM